MRRGKKPKWYQIYIIRDGSGWLKIGIAADSQERLEFLQVGNPRRLEIIKTFPVVKSRAVSVEHAIHSMLSSYERSGEWFKITEQLAIECCLRATADWHQYLKKQPKFTQIARLGQQAYIEIRSLE